MFISSFLQSTGGQGSEQKSFSLMPAQGPGLWEVRDRDACLHLSEGQSPFKQAIRYDYNNKRNEKRVKETVFNRESELASSLHHLGTHGTGSSTLRISNSSSSSPLYKTVNTAYPHPRQTRGHLQVTENTSDSINAMQIVAGAANPSFAV